MESGNGTRRRKITIAPGYLLRVQRINISIRYKHSAMKPAFSRLLLLGAALIILYSCQEKKSPQASAGATSARQELLVGKWQFDSIDLGSKKDSSDLDITAAYLVVDQRYKQIQFVFTKDGIMSEYNDGDTTSAPFELKDDSVIVLMEEEPNEAFTLVTVDSTSLRLKAEDSVFFLFRRIKEKQ
jgi:hypothetical protein